MATVNVEIKILHPALGESIALPRPMSAHAAGCDLAAAIDAPLVIPPGARDLVPCGFSMALPVGFEAQVRPRSGLALKHGVTVLNAPGTIDADYRGEVKVLLINLGEEPFTIQPGDRIAQMVVCPVSPVMISVVTTLSETGRGADGFGSTGMRAS